MPGWLYRTDLPTIRCVCSLRRRERVCQGPWDGPGGWSGVNPRSWVTLQGDQISTHGRSLPSPWPVPGGTRRAQGPQAGPGAGCMGSVFCRLSSGLPAAPPPTLPPGGPCVFTPGLCPAALQRPRLLPHNLSLCSPRLLPTTLCHRRHSHLVLLPMTPPDSCLPSSSAAATHPHAPLFHPWAPTCDLQGSPQPGSVFASTCPTRVLSVAFLCPPPGPGTTDSGPAAAPVRPWAGPGIVSSPSGPGQRAESPATPTVPSQQTAVCTIP